MRGSRDSARTSEATRGGAAARRRQQSAQGHRSSHRQTEKEARRRTTLPGRPGRVYGQARAATGADASATVGGFGAGARGVGHRGGQARGEGWKRRAQGQVRVRRVALRGPRGLRCRARGYAKYSAVGERTRAVPGGADGLAAGKVQVHRG
eukprot:8147100-Pyramimonas_sp.AAC.1